MINPNAHIVVQEYYTQVLDSEITTYTYQWEGGKIAGVSRYGLIKHLGLEADDYGQGDVFYLGPFRLRVVEVDYLSDSLLVMRDGWPALAMIKLYSLTRYLELIKYRFILTLVVWKLAYCEPGAKPQWRDVYLVEKLCRLFKRES